MNGTVNRGELLINVVKTDKPKRLSGFRKKPIGLGQKGKGSGIGVNYSSIADVVPPAEKQNLTHSMVYTRNVESPYFSRWIIIR